MSKQKEINQHFKDDIEFVRKIETLMAKVTIMGDNKRDMLLAGFSRNLISHFISINYLMDEKLYNSAFALERIFFENIIKLKYMYYVMTDSKIDIIYSADNWNNHFPSIGEMAEAIDKKLETKLYSIIKQNTYQFMNDYTHTGPNQIARNFSEIDALIKSNFSDDLILNILQGNRILLKISMIDFIESIGLQNDFINKKEIEEYMKY